jgi:hypothetical protein
LELSIAEELEDGTFELLLRMPEFKVLVSNPPPPKIMEDERRSVVGGLTILTNGIQTLLK